MTSALARVGLALLLLMITSQAWSQNLEPRRWAHLPINANFIGLGATNSSGEIFLDPVLHIEDGEMELYALAAGYIHSFNLLGKTARMEVNVPYANGRWEGLLRGEPASTRRSGFADPSVRFAVNLLGSPALQGKEFAAYRAANPIKTIVGLGLDLTLPLGNYNSNRLIDLGNNRYVMRPQLGVLHQRNKWEFETTASVFLYGRNDEFFQGSVLEQDPLWFVQGHVSYTFKPGLWADLGAGYGFGGESTISGDKKDDAGRVSFWAASFGWPINAKQGLKLTYAFSQTNTRRGSDLDTIIFSWNMML
jgi:hypothetical protein